MFSTKWSFYRNSIMPNIEVKGECNFTPIVTTIENLILYEAIKIIDEANKFKGIPSHYKPSLTSECPLCVSFSIIFPTEVDLNRFVKFLERES